jgi:hypothetical protein
VKCRATDEIGGFIYKNIYPENIYYLFSGLFPRMLADEGARRWPGSAVFGVQWGACRCQMVG